MSLECRINGTAYEMTRDFQIAEQAGNKSSTTINVLVETQPVPKAGDVVEVIDTYDNTVVFWGIAGIPSSPKYSTLFDTQIYKIVCSGANALLSNRIINVAYQNYTITQIVQDLYGKYIQAEGITLGAISNIAITLEVYTASNYNLQSALNELADMCSAVWRVDENREFSFVVSDDFTVFPHTIDSDYLLGGDIQHKTKNYNTRTVQYISGATDTTSSQTENFLYDGEQETFTTSFALIQKPVIKVNGTTVASSKIGVNGIDDNNPNIEWTFSFASQVVTYKGSTMASGSTVTIVYTGQFPIRLASYNWSKINEIAALTGTSGFREQVYIATDIKTTKDAQQLASSLLAQFATETEEVSFYLLSDQLYALGLTLSDIDVLTQVNIDLPEINIQGSYVITERKLSPAYADMTNAKGKYRADLKLMSRNYLKSYGEVLSDIRRDIAQLRVREDETIINDVNNQERIKCLETTLIGQGLPHCCIGAVQYGSQFAQMSFGQTVYTQAG